VVDNDDDEEFVEKVEAFGDSDDDLDDVISTIKDNDADMIKIFSCRHVFHMRCLHRYFKKN
jgi:hypothetical protein